MNDATRKRIEQLKGQGFGHGTATLLALDEERGGTYTDDSGRVWTPAEAVSTIMDARSLSTAIRAAKEAEASHPHRVVAEGGVYERWVQCACDRRFRGKTCNLAFSAWKRHREASLRQEG